MNKDKIPDWSFQEDAVKKVVKDFLNNPFAKKLLVIPTGGGKTTTAFRIINELIKDNFLKPDKKVIWIVHTKWLKKQANIKLNEDAKKFNFSKQIFNIVDIKMKKEARNILLSSESGRYKFLIIDEAHHSAAETYSDFFAPNIGVLGLTATPTRTDDLELDFADISYEITFRELVNRGVILLPETEEVKTEMSIDIDSIDYYSPGKDFDKFSFDERNNFIAEEIFKRKNRYKKIVVFVGSNKHVKDLYRVLEKKNRSYLQRPYNHIGYIYGGDNNEKNISNDEYLDDYRKATSSILVNCLILNEGYDDPNINAVVMATPSNSILYYMQCIGRVVRNSGNDSKAYVLELIDKLPNINYRINNRWLYTEISDYLEPEIIDIYYKNRENLKEVVSNVMKAHKVKHKYQNLLPENINDNNFNLLLYADSPLIEGATWKPFFLTGEKANYYINMFNKLSFNINKYNNFNDEYLFFSEMKITKNDYMFSNQELRISLIGSLSRAYKRKINREKVDCLKYFAFKKKKMSWWELIIDTVIKIYKKIKLVYEHNS